MADAKIGGNRTNSVPTKEIKIRTTEKVLLDLRALVESGYFGKSPGEAAELVLKEGLRQIMREGRFLLNRD